MPQELDQLYQPLCQDSFILQELHDEFSIIRKTTRQARGKRSVLNTALLRRNEAYYFFQHSCTNALTKKEAPPTHIGIGGASFLIPRVT